MRTNLKADDVKMIVDAFYNRGGASLVTGETQQAICANSRGGGVIGLPKITIEPDIILKDKKRPVILDTTLPKQVMARIAAKFAGRKGKAAPGFRMPRGEAFE